MARPKAHFLNKRNDEDALAFIDTDNGMVIVLASPHYSEKNIRITLGDKMIKIKMPMLAMNSLVIKTLPPLPRRKSILKKPRFKRVICVMALLPGLVLAISGYSFAAPNIPTLAAGAGADRFNSRAQRGRGRNTDR